MTTKPLRYHALRKGTDTTLCGFFGHVADAVHPVDCLRCKALMAGGYGQRVSPRFNFPAGSAASAPHAAVKP